MSLDVIGRFTFLVAAMGAAYYLGVGLTQVPPEKRAGYIGAGLICAAWCAAMWGAM